MIKEFYRNNKKLVIIIHVLTIICICLLSAYHSKLSKDEFVFIFTTDNRIEDDLLVELENIANEHGILEVSSNSYQSKDSNFAQVINTVGFYSSDFFVMSKDIFERYKDSDAFISLNKEIIELSDDVITDSKGNIIAVKVNDNYYVGAGKNRNKPTELIVDMIKYIIANGDDLFE